MELQRILARDTRTAMEKVFSLYGEDAMVVANNKIKGQTEIIVAIDLVSQVKAAFSAESGQAAEVSEEANFGSLLEAQLFDPPTSEVVEEKSSDELTFGSLFEASAEQQAPPVDPLVDVPLSAVSNAWNGENYKEAAEREQLKAREIVDLVKQELSVMRNEFRIAQQKDSWTGTLAVAEEMRPLIEAFNETGMPLELRGLIIDIINQSSSMIEALAGISTAISNGVEHIDLFDGMQGIHIIAGSSGAGKTLMAGRLAKQMAQVYEEDEVALVSFSDARIGAWTQTQLIGAQSGVEAFRATSLDILAQLMAELSTRKLIIIDTSGVDVDAQIAALVEAFPQAQKHLVLASDASEASAKRHLTPNGIKWDSVMLSRLEAQIHPWAVINALLNNSVPLSIAAEQPTISDNAIALNGISLAEKALSQLPIHFV
ncbi:hypothetical protein OAI12_01535 [Porticoccaceae bacterium]|nr:hypothetical protein [Porticoccaceae bacterium]